MSENSHDCSALVFVCIDWRLHPAVENFFKEKYQKFDLCASAGSIKDFNSGTAAPHILSQMETSYKLHHPKEIILTIHIDCGAYGGSKAFSGKEAEYEHHRRELDIAASKVVERFPNLAIKKYIIDLESKDGQWIILPFVNL